MILEYTIKNNLSFKNEQKLSILPSKKTELIDSVITEGKYTALPLVAIYGENASGKTNTLKGLRHIYDMIVLSHGFDPVRPIPFYKPYLFGKNLSKESNFEITFIVNEKKYKYSFTHDDSKILKEILVVYRTSKATKIFERTYGASNEYVFGIEYADLHEYIKKTHDNKLFLSCVAQWAANIKEIADIYDFFRNGLIYYQKDCDKMTTDYIDKTTKLLIKNNEAKIFLKKLIKYLNLGFEEVIPSQFTQPLDELKDMPNEIKEILKVLAADTNNGSVIEGTDVNMLYQVDGESYSLNLRNESNGIKKIYQLFPFIFEALIKKKIIVIDEIEIGIHPTLVKKLVKLFQTKEINKNGSQLIFTTHLTDLLDIKLLRRDEIYFTERNSKDFSTKIFSLASITGTTKRENIKENYLAGKYTKVPIYEEDEEIKFKSLLESFTTEI